MIVFRPNVRAYMPGVDIVNRPAVAAAASSDWWLAGGTIAAGNVVQYAESVSNLSFTGSTIAGGEWTWVARFDLPDSIPSNINVFDSSFVISEDYIFQLLTLNQLRVLCPSLVPSNYSYTPADDVVFFFVCSEPTLTLYINNVSVWTANPTGSGKWENGGSVGVLLSGAPACDYIALYDVALDATQRGNLYSLMSA